MPLLVCDLWFLDQCGAKQALTLSPKHQKMGGDARGEQVGLILIFETLVMAGYTHLSLSYTRRIYFVHEPDLSASVNRSLHKYDRESLLSLSLDRSLSLFEKVLWWVKGS